MALVNAAGTRRRGGHFHRDQDLVVRERVLTRPGEEFVDRDVAFAIRPQDLGYRVEDRERRRCVRGGGGVRDVAADGRHVARLHGANEPRAIRQRGVALLDDRLSGDRRHVNLGANAETVRLVELQVVQVGHGVQADYRGGVQAGFLHMHQQVGAAGEQLDAIAALFEQRHGLLQRLWCQVLESMHGARPL